MPRDIWKRTGGRCLLGLLIDESNHCVANEVSNCINSCSSCVCIWVWLADKVDPAMCVVLSFIPDVVIIIIIWIFIMFLPVLCVHKLFVGKRVVAYYQLQLEMNEIGGMEW